MSCLDPRAPLVLDTRELGRRPGSQRELDLTVSAPARLGIDILAVPEGALIELDLRLEAVMEGVLLTGSASAELRGECSKCLDQIEEKLLVDLQELYLYDEGEPDEEVSVLEEDLLDLEPHLRDAVVLSLPYQPVCRQDCPGLCPECGAKLADDPTHQHEQAIDPRWAGLEALSTTMKDEEQEN